MKNRFQYITLGAILTLIIFIGSMTLLLSNTRALQPTNTQIKQESQAGQHIQYKEATQTNTLQDNGLQEETFRKERENLINKWRQSVTAQPGWWHQITEYEQAEVDISTSPNGTTIPAKYIMDYWFYFDESGIVTKSIGYMKDLQGNILQFVAYQDGIWQNFTLGEKSTGSAPAPWSEADELSTAVNINRQELVSEKGIPIISFTARNMHSPSYLDDIDALVSGHMVRKVFDAETGQPRLVERIMLLADGTEIFSDKFEVTLMERVNELPEAIKEIELE